MSTEVARLGTNLENPNHNRKIVVLSDNSVMCFVQYDTTTIRAYHSSNRSTWTLKFSITVSPGSGIPSGSGFSCAIEPGNHIQVVYQVEQFSLYRRRYTYDGGYSWTAGAAEVVWAATAGWDFVGIDIDVLGTNQDACFVVWRAWDRLTGNGRQVLYGRARGTGGWGAATKLVDLSGPEWYGYLELPFVSANVGGPVNNVQSIYCGSVLNASGVSGGVGGVHGIVKADITNGTLTQTSFPTTQYFADLVNEVNFGTMTAFPISDNKWIGVEFHNFANNVCAMRPWIAEWTGGVLTRTFLVSVSVPIHTSTAWYRPAVTFTANQKLVIWTRTTDPEYGLHAVVYDIATQRSYQTFGYPSQGVDLDTTLQYGTRTHPYAGQQRHVTTTADVIMFEQTKGKTIHEYNQAVPAPSSGLKPLNGALVTTDLPIVSINLPPMQGVRFLRKAEWQIATNNIFTTNLKQFAEPDSTYNSLSTRDYTVPTIHELNQGVKYIRARNVDPFGKVSAWFGTNSFTVSHPPVAIPQTPSGGLTYEYGTGNKEFAWTFADSSPTDNQTAYQIIVEKQSDGTEVVNTGKIAQVNDFDAIVAIPSSAQNIPLRWKIRVWDSDDIAGAYSSYAYMQYGGAFSITIVSPAEGSTVDRPAPLVNWTVSGGTQSKFLVRVFSNVSTLPKLYDSGWRTSSVTEFQIPTPVLDLNHPSGFLIDVLVQNTQGDYYTDINVVYANWTAVPAPVTNVSIANYDSDGYVTVTWTNAAIDDDKFIGWRVYRRKTGTLDWTLLYEIRQNQANYEYHDWTATTGTTYDYVVVQVAYRFGAETESPRTGFVTVTPISSSYWLVHPTDNSKNVRLASVKSDEFVEEYESTVINLIGRGRKVDYGSRWGYIGTLNCQVIDKPNKTARQSRFDLEALKAERTKVYLRNPFGDIWLVDLGNAQIGRIAGVGSREFHELTITYTEITDGPTITSVNI